MSKKFDYCSFLNGNLEHFNEKYRKRSEREFHIRNTISSFPIGDKIDLGVNAGEALCHQKMYNIEGYYDRNIMNHKDSHERHWDAFKRTTDIDYSAGDGCGIF